MSSRLAVVWGNFQPSSEAGAIVRSERGFLATDEKPQTTTQLELIHSSGADHGSRERLKAYS